MTHFKKKTIFGNKYSIKKLTEFRDLVVRYFKNLSNNPNPNPNPNPNFPQDKAIHNPYAIEGVLFESKEAKKIRSEINKCFYTIEGIMLDAEIDPSVIYYSQQERCHKKISVLSDIFILNGYNIESDRLLDFIDRAIGVYSHDKILSIIRTFNPIFWFIRCLDFVFNTPFYLLQNAGFKTEEMQSDFMIKLLKFIFNCIAIIFTVWKLLNRII